MEIGSTKEKEDIYRLQIQAEKQLKINET